MAIPNNYIEKITDHDSRDTRYICPAADKVRVENENYEGDNLDDVLDKIASDISDAGSGTVTGVKMNGGTPIAPDQEGVVNLGTVITQHQDISNKVDKVTGKGLSTEDYTTADKAKLGDLPTKAELDEALDDKADVDEIPEKVSDLENDEGYVTAQDVAGIVAATGDLTIVESSNYVDILISYASLEVTQLASMSASTKSGTFKVSGTHLKGDVTISTSATNWLLSADGGTTTSQSLTLSPTNGTLAETTITVIYSGSTDSTNNEITVASSGATSVTVTANYTVYAGPTILVSPSSLSFNAAPNGTQEKTISVSGANLTGNISVAKSGTNASLFTLSANSLTASGGEITVTYQPTAEGSHSAKLTLSSTGAESVEINLDGASEAAVVIDENGHFTKNGIAYGIIYNNNEPTTDLAVYNSSYNTTNGTSTYTGAITIPSTITVNGTTYTVKRIKARAFYSSSVTSLILPDTVTAIEDDSIRNMSSLTSVKLPNGSITQLGGGTFSACGALNLDNVDFGSITNTGAWFYCNNGSGKQVTIPAQITNIGTNSFSSTTFNRITFGDAEHLSNSLSIGSLTFQMTGTNARVEIYRSAKPTLAGQSFRNTSNGYPCGAKLYVPASILSSYTSASDWTNMFGEGNILAFDEQ